MLTASTFFFIDEGADSGDILSQELLEIKRDDNAASLYRKMTDTALAQIESFLPWLEAGIYQRIPQDHSKANTWRKRSREDGEIDFRMTSEAIYNLVRGLIHPYAGAHLCYEGKDIKIWNAEIVFGNFRKNIEPGKILKRSENRLVVKTYDGAVALTDYEFEKLPNVGDYL